MKNRQAVLVVDDEPEIIEIVTFQLRRNQFDVVSASDGSEALKLLTERKFSAVICDLQMPILNGISLLKEVRSRKLLTPFIFLSGHADEKDEKEMINYGAYQLLSKLEILHIPDVLHRFLATHEKLDLDNVGKDEMDFLEILNETIKKVG